MNFKLLKDPFGASVWRSDIEWCVARHVSRMFNAQGVAVLDVEYPAFACQQFFGPTLIPLDRLYFE